MRECGWQYRLSRIDRVAKRPSCPAVAGTLFHTVSESIDFAIDGQEQVRDHDELVAYGYAVLAEQAEPLILAEEEHSGYARDTWKRYGRRTNDKPHGEDMDWFIATGITSAIHAWVTWRLDHPEWSVAEMPSGELGIEVEFEYKLEDETPMVGFIDRVMQHADRPGNFYPFDLKTGRKPKTDEQLGIYGAAVARQFGMQPSYGVYIYGLKTGVAKITSPIDIRHWTDEKLNSVYMPTNLMIKQGLYVPNPGEACFHCPVADHCQFVQSAI